MKFLIKIFNFHLKIIYSIFKIFKTKNKILFMSRQSNDLSIDFDFLIKEINKRDNNISVVVLCKKMEKGIKGKISYYFHLYKQMYHLSTSKVCITDSYSPTISILNHKENLKVIQIWHALGAIKKFGYQTVGLDSGRNEVIAEGAGMHKNYDYIISGSKEMTKYFSKAFNYPQNKFMNFGLPRIDYLRKNKEELKKQIYKKYPKLKNKINILYAPTFRTYGSDATQNVIDAFKDTNYNVIIKNHALQKLSVNKNKKVFTCDEFSSMQMLEIADYLITDYSAIAIEAACIDVKTLYYVFDYEKYESSNGLNINLFKEMPGCVFDNMKDIKSVIKNNKYDIRVLEKYKEKYLPNIKTTSTEKIVDLIMGELV